MTANETLSEPEAAPHQSRSGFSPSINLLLNLLILGSIAMVLTGALTRPGSRVLMESKAKSTMRNAYQIHTAFYAYAQNHNQEVPDGKTANEVYRQLISAGIIDDEKIFYVQGCAWCAKKPDRDVGTPESGSLKALGPGENHWAYVRGLNSAKDDSKLPIIADGFAEGKPGQWSNDPKKKGGVWKGKYAIVVRIDGSSKVHQLDSSLTAKEKRSGRDVNIFSAAYGINPDNILNPE